VFETQPVSVFVPSDVCCKGQARLAALVKLIPQQFCMAKIQVCWNMRNVFIAIRLWSARADDVPWLLLTAFQMQGTPAASDELHGASATISVVAAATSSCS
jgi:hypothetical protein